MKKTELDSMQFIVGRWANATFNRSGRPEDFAAVLEHMQRELDELKDSREPEEAADVFLCLLHFCHMAGFSLGRETTKKLEINMLRKWGKPDAQGVIEHIREVPA